MYNPPNPLRDTAVVLPVMESGINHGTHTTKKPSTYQITGLDLWQTLEPPPGLSKVPEPTHIVFTVSSNKALYRGLQLHVGTNVGGCPWHEFVSNWGMNAIICSIPKVHLV